MRALGQWFPNYMAPPPKCARVKIMGMLQTEQPTDEILYMLTHPMKYIKFSSVISNHSVQMSWN
jgi:hypothetical protein